MLGNLQMDSLLVIPDSSKAYQGLAAVYSAIEPPTWALLLGAVPDNHLRCILSHCFNIAN